MQNEFQKAYANLSAIKNNVKGSGHVYLNYIELYHKEIDRLIGLSFDIIEYKIPDTEIEDEISSMTYYDMGQGTDTEYSGKRFVNERYFMTKMEALMNLFQIKGADFKIGFQDRTE